MSLSEALIQLAGRPASARVRARAAAELAALDRIEAETLWAAAVRTASARGQFFVALTLARRHLSGPLLERLLYEMAERYSDDRVPLGPPLHPSPEAHSLLVPKSRSEQIALLLKLGCDHRGVRPPDDVYPEIPLFGALPTEAFVLLAENIEEIFLQPDDALVEQGSTEAVLYLLAKGEARVTQKKRDRTVTLAEVAGPAVVGELSLLTALPRRASVRMIDRGVAWRIGADTLRQVGAAGPRLVRRLRRLARRRLIANLVHQSELLIGVRDLPRIIDRFELQSFEPGAEVFGQGERAPGLYLVLHGWAEVHEVESDLRVARLSEGDAFGEMSLMSHAPTCAAVRMPEGGLLLHLPPEIYEELRAEVGALDGELRSLAEHRTRALCGLVEPLRHSFNHDEDGWFDTPAPSR